MVLLLCALAFGAARANESELRVCADANNLPYSHANGTGFENRIAQLVAEDLGVRVAYTWHPQLRGFIRKTLDANACDVVIGVPSAFERVRTTRPYYRSTYVFVYRADHGRSYRSFTEAALTKARIGVQLVGDDLAATPPGHALAKRGIIDNVVGYPVLGERPQAARMVDAVTNGDIDVALVWGPQAAWYARRSQVPLVLVPAKAPAELARMPFEFSMSMGVRKADVALQQKLDGVLARRRADIDAILGEYGIPRADGIIAVTGASSQ